MSKSDFRQTHTHTHTQIYKFHLHSGKRDLHSLAWFIVVLNRDTSEQQTLNVSLWIKIFRQTQAGCDEDKLIFDWQTSAGPNTCHPCTWFLSYFSIGRIQLHTKQDTDTTEANRWVNRFTNITKILS